ncbi:MAG: 2,3-bisphosphoglycerate-independent phosphoglycerate mutase [Candidatus Magasanikbacteria bacterium]|nr:2,3-bisphosphoglycerate-independent phosphoglycerate mutase [Candidatus Magasanikbacteria bacterium]
MNRIKPIVLAIVDGWGIAPLGKSNAISEAQTPHIDKFISEYPVMSLFGSGQALGLRDGEFGNSHVGHLNIGAGRICYHMLTRIHMAILDGSFFQNKTLVGACAYVSSTSGAVHIIGMLSDSGFHGDIAHIYALLKLAEQEGISKVYVHVILDGETIAPTRGLEFVRALEVYMKELGVGEIASVSGRYFAMDRDGHWERTGLAYRAIVEGISTHMVLGAVDAIEASYAEGIYDTKIIPTVIAQDGKPIGAVLEGDAVIFSTVSSDRMRQLTQAVVLPHFSKFERMYLKNLEVVTMSMYEKELPVFAAFRPLTVFNSLPQVISKAGLRQLHIAETEKYADITYFLNGNIDEPFEEESRILISSPEVSSYDKTPQMAAHRITTDAIRAVNADTYHAIFVNYTNLDSVARTGNMSATIKACEYIDKMLGALSEYVRAKDGVLCITASVGGAEEMYETSDGVARGSIGKNPVPFIIVSDAYRGISSHAGDPFNGDLSLVKPAGLLADVAPTFLKLLGVGKPEEMTGRVLV